MFGHYIYQYECGIFVVAIVNVPAVATGLNFGSVDQFVCVDHELIVQVRVFYQKLKTDFTSTLHNGHALLGEVMIAIPVDTGREEILAVNRNL